MCFLVIGDRFFSQMSKNSLKKHNIIHRLSENPYTAYNKCPSIFCTLFFFFLQSGWGDFAKKEKGIFNCFHFIKKRKTDSLLAIFFPPPIEQIVYSQSFFRHR